MYTKTENIKYMGIEMVKRRYSILEKFEAKSSSWDEMYSNPRDFRSYNFISRRRYALDMFDKKGGVFLDVGCGTGDFLSGLLEIKGKVFAIDISQKMLAKAKERFGDEQVRFSLGEAGNLSFQDECFDGVLCIGVLEYLNNDKKVLSEFNRVLKKDGIMVLSVPNIASPFMVFDTVASNILKLFKDVLVQKHYLPWRLDRMLSESGFKKVAGRFCTFGSFMLGKYMPFSVSLSRKMEVFSTSFLGLLGTNYIIKAVKK